MLKVYYVVVGVVVYCVFFIEDMVGVYEWVDLVICCFGVLIVVELVVVGVVSILVFFLYVVDDY